jgi:hypothetical protein
MTVTRHQAMTADRFHEDHGPTGKIYEWRRNGVTRTWKTRPDDFRTPIKYGLNSYDQLTPSNAHTMHVAEECPTRHVRVSWTETPGDDRSFFGIVIAEVVPDRAGNGITRVQVTTRGTSKHRVGSQVDVATKRLTYL